MGIFFLSFFQNKINKYSSLAPKKKTLFKYKNEIIHKFLSPQSKVHSSKNFIKEWQTNRMSTKYEI